MAFYDNFSKTRNSKPTYLGFYIIEHWYNYFHKAIKHNTDKKKIHLLEIGPGKGYFASLTKKEESIKYTAIEINEKLATKLRSDGFNVITGSVPPIKTTKKFDVIYLNQVFEHMPNWMTALELLTEIKRKLNKNGLAIIICPDIDFWGTDFFVGDYTHSFPTSKRNLQQISLDAEFEIVESGNYTLLTRSVILCQLITTITKLAYSLGIFKILFNKKAFKIKSALLPSTYVILKNKQ